MQTTRALEGIRVVECGRMVAAAYAGKLLADMGAEVIKVEEPDGDPSRYWPLGADEGAKVGNSSLFLYLNQGKKGITLDLLRPRGQELLRKLAMQVDVLIHNYPASEMAARGLDYEWLASVNSSLVMSSISPFGLSGPHKDYRGYDINVLAAGGWLWLNGVTGRPELPPLKPYGAQSEYQSGVAAAVAVMGALLWRLETGQGQHIEISAQEVVATELEFVFPFWSYERRVPVRWGHRIVAPWDYFRCKDGWVFVICVEEHQWQALVELMGNPEWAHWEIFGDRLLRGQNYDALKPFLDEWFANHTVAELYDAARERRIPLGPVLDVPGLLSSAHLQARNFFVHMEHPIAGRLTYPASPYRFCTETPAVDPAPAPLLGQHNREIFCGLLGLPQSEFDNLRGGGVI